MVKEFDFLDKFVFTPPYWTLYGIKTLKLDSHVITSFAFEKKLPLIGNSKEYAQPSGTYIKGTKRKLKSSLCYEGHSCSKCCQSNHLKRKLERCHNSLISDSVWNNLICILCIKQQILLTLRVNRCGIFGLLIMQGGGYTH